ncbi:hypothetical protein ASG01_14550 [Chryseobacterium sp. Leaf180]|uniref:hypothetical protein n=1 Tax=Chryseobacterium sp. Leaf180 TaxID=1736289 RepID=UPI0007019FCE|nr:hypothetical protein [Chryseobacterium sp. Leaf180]KQR91100.1 hypothetical protein ASG01_14550 [Chryseobacterium sp. Leaf180]
MKKLLLSLAIALSVGFHAQKSEIFKLKKFRIAVLNDTIKESSGLNFFGNDLFTFNDSGNPAELFKIDPKSGKILKTFKANAENTDWEALANDGQNFFIGDFGNNAGKRTDLKIYKIPYADGILDNTKVQILPFYYPEQKDFNPQKISTDFDLESMIYLHGKIHIFTKEWTSKTTAHYILDPANSENQAAQKVESFQTNFLVTDASYFNGKLYVVGYTKKTEVFLDVFDETEPGIFFKNRPKQFYLGSALGVGQIEGIAVNGNGIYISSEKFVNPVKKTAPYLYFIPHGKLKL